MAFEFEFDPIKGATNKDKHGIDFETAQRLWDDDNAFRAPAIPGIEERWMLVARFDGKLWVAIHTMRGEVIRLISVRRARPGEEAAYERARDEKARTDRR
jgi:uncharacterized DUF497 family protein